MRYIPAHEILERNNAPLAIPVGRQKLIPDQLFALDYGGTYRAFALEVDRGTEPKTSPAKRKSWAQSIELYRQLIEGALYRRHYGLKASLLVLWVFNSRANEERFLEMVEKLDKQACRSVFATSYPGPLPTGAGYAELEDALAKPWHSPGGAELAILSA